MNAQPTAVLEENPRRQGLALRLDDGTRKSHSVAQNSAFVTGFFKGIADRRSFGQLVASLYFVYAAMEEAFDQTQDPAVKALDFPELRRTASLEQDMAYFYGPEWRRTVRPTAAASKYVQRVQEVAASAPRLLIAHQYTRYLGDLFGGQMMSGMAVKTLNLEDGQGVGFYRFNDIPNPEAFIRKWYSQLNALDLPDRTQQEIVDEANLVFDLNIGILEELGGNPLSSMFSLLWKSVLERFRG